MSALSRSASAGHGCSHSRFSVWRFGGLLGLLFGIFFAPVLIGWEAFSFIDAGLFGYPLAFYLRESLWQGELPLWNPLNNCGVPFLAQWNTMALYPPCLLYVLLPMPWSYNVFCVGHLVLAGLGMYFLARRWTGSELAGALAGTVFAFNGLTWWGLMWPNIIAGMAWMPWLMLVVEDAWRKGGVDIIRAAIVGAMQILTGGAEVIPLTWLFIGIWAAVTLARKEVRWAGLVTRSVVMCLLVFALSAAQLLPFLDLLAHSQRSGSYADASTAAMAPTGWVNYLVPLFHQCRNVQGLFVPANLSWTGSYYLGIGTLFLATYAVWRARSPRVWLLAGMTLFSLLMALGSAGFVYEPLKRLLPMLGFIRFPAKYVILATFTLPLIAAYGLAQWRGAEGRKPGESRSLAILAAGFVVVIGLIALAAWKAPLPKDDVPATLMNAASRVAILGAFIGGVALLSRVWKWRRPLEIGLLVLLWIDVYTHSSNLSPTAPAAAFEPNAIRKHFGWENQLDPGSSRAMVSPQAMGKMLTAGSPNPLEDIQARRLALYMNLNTLDHIPKVDGFFPLEPADWKSIERMYFAPQEPKALLDFLGVSHMSSPTNALQWVQRSSSLPLVTAGQKPEFVPQEEALGRMFSTEFAPAREVFLPVEARSAVGERAATEARVVTSRFSAHRLDVEVEAEAKTVLVIAQMYYHCWSAYLDGRPVPLWKANAAFQAVGVPAGRHRVELIYEDRMFQVGAVISGVGWAGCFGFWWWLKRRSQSCVL